jgi:hypothetical protein
MSRSNRPRIVDPENVADPDGARSGANEKNHQSREFRGQKRPQGAQPTRQRRFDKATEYSHPENQR